jgi:hypothetical protein
VTKLNGWKRIGIIVSVLWIPCAWVHTFDSATGRASASVASAQAACDGSLAGKTGDAWTKGFNECDRQADESLALALTNARQEAALIALAPVPLGWGFAYLVLFLVQWVKRGFAQSL